jgi:hypothetical protein
MQSTKLAVAGLAVPCLFSAISAGGAAVASAQPQSVGKAFFSASAGTATPSFVLAEGIESKRQSFDWYEEITRHAAAAIDQLLRDVGPDYSAQSDALAQRTDENLARLTAWFKDGRRR